MNYPYQFCTLLHLIRFQKWETHNRGFEAAQVSFPAGDKETVGWFMPASRSKAINSKQKPG